MFMTAGQLASYDQAKMMLLATRFFKDDPITHFTYSLLPPPPEGGQLNDVRSVLGGGGNVVCRASTIAGIIAAVITSPLDVVKSRVMNAEKGFYKGSLDCTLRVIFSLFSSVACYIHIYISYHGRHWQTLKAEGPLAFYRGFVPYAIRLTPHTIITFLAFEQFNKYARSYPRPPRPHFVEQNVTGASFVMCFTGRACGC
jgi:hypothetical protein